MDQSKHWQMTHNQPWQHRVEWLVVGLSCLCGIVTTADELRPLTWRHVYGRERIIIRDPAPQDFVWLDETTLLRQESSWEKIDAVTGKSTPFYDAKRLHECLTASAVTEQEAKEITDGHWTLHHPQKRVCVLQSNQRLIHTDLDGNRVAVVDGLPENMELLTLSPTGDVCVFVADNNLWCADFSSKEIRQLTFEIRKQVRNGKADWLYYEEVLKRKWKAFRFSSDGQLLLFQQFDDTDVPTFSIIDHSQPEQTIETYHFPKAGERNPAVKLGVVAVGGGPVTWMAAPHDDRTTLITHFGWYPNSKHIYWYTQNRSQTWLDVIRSSAISGQSEVLLRETTGGWVEQPGDLWILQNGHFLWLSERFGWKHVEQVTADGKTRFPLTSGPWDVNRIHTVNEETNSIIVSGTRDSPLADNIYQVSLKNGSVVRLSHEPGNHIASVDPSGSLLIDRCSSHQARTSVTVRSTRGEFERQIHQATPPEVWDEFEFGDVSFRKVPLADGQSCRALFVFPPHFDASQPHPVWLKIYGGPRFQKVKDEWNARLGDHLLATHGVVVVYFDPRTAGGHGASGAWMAHHRLGMEETRDVEVLCAWLSEQPWADGSRIGMSGHSYGGFLTSYVMTHSECLVAGIAGSPVTDWANYDTIYTERYMGTPQANPEGYRGSSVVSAASALHGRLLLVHGLKDDNVHPSNTFQLVRALQQFNHHFDLMVYPRARHGVHNQHYRKLCYDFILKWLEIVVENL